MYISGEHDMCAVVEQFGQIHALDVGGEVVPFVVDVVVSAQTGFAAFVQRIARHIHAHRLQIHLCGLEVSLCAQCG